jgi:DNA primase
MRIPEDKIEEIRQQANLEDIIGEFVRLKKSGKNYLGLCPFHPEKTPSFSVSPEKQIFYCFGCGKGGNVFNFLMAIKNISYIEAVKEVADRVGIDLTSFKKKDNNDDRKEVYYKINEIAADYFFSCLKNISVSKEAIDYLKKRGLTRDSILSFKIGFNPDEWESLTKYLMGKNIDLKIALKLGLVGLSKEGRYYDKFKGRIIFPIRNTAGKIVGFGARILKTDANVAKYINSPESPVYQKKSILFGLYNSKEEIRNKGFAIIVEGYMDAISLFQNGIKNVVAASGTAFSEEQAKLLSKYAKEAILLFDADEAGYKAALRTSQILYATDFNVKIAVLPEKKDPDEFILQYGKNNFEEILKNAQNFIEFSYNLKIRNLDDRHNPEYYAKAVKETVEIISYIPDQIKREAYIKLLSEKYSISEQALILELNKNKSKNENIIPYQKKDEIIPKKLSKFEKKIYLYEKEFIKLLFSGKKEIADYIFSEVNSEDFSNEKLFKLFEIIQEVYYQKNEFNAAVIIDVIEDEELKKFAISTALELENKSEIWNELANIDDEKLQEQKLKLAKDLIAKFKLVRLQNEIQNLNEIFAQTYDENQKVEILNQITKLQQERLELQRIEEKK